MIRTANLRRQHNAALEIIQQIVALSQGIGAAPTHAQAYDITMLLAKLTGLLRIHFAQEDTLLYPSLMASGNGAVAATAHRFFTEMGQIGPAFAAFAQRWCAPAEIEADPAGFDAESAALFAALGDRIRRENEELYPLVDAAADSGVSRPDAA